MKIPYQQIYDQVTQGCCDCSFPTCSAPVKECESINVYGELEWDFQKFPGPEYYRGFTREWSDGGSQQRYYTQDYNVYYEGWPSNADAAIDVATLFLSSTDPQTGTMTETELGPIDVGQAASDAYTVLQGLTVDWDNEDLDYQSACNNDIIINDGSINFFAATFSRFRWTLPEGFAGGYHKITWDEVMIKPAWESWYNSYKQYLEDLAQWNECMENNDNDEDLCGAEPNFTTSQPSPGPVKLATRTWEWTTGNPETSNWYEIPFYDPSGDAEKEAKVIVTNVRVWCYRYASHGVLPTLIGDDFSKYYIS